MERGSTNSGCDAQHLNREWRKYLERPQWPVSRRSFVRTAAAFASGAFAVLAGLPLLSCGESGRSNGSTDDGRERDARALARRMLEMFEDRARVASLGRAVLAMAPDEATVLTLVAKLTSGWTDVQRAQPTPELHATLRSQLRSDFEAGRTLRVAGWVLGRTEARLAALAALSVAA